MYRVADVRDWIATRDGWRRWLAAFVAGSLSVLGFAPFFASPVLFFSLPVLVWLIDSSSGPKRAAAAGWWFGFGYFMFSLFWIGEAFLVEAEKFAVLLPFAVTLLPAGLAVYWALAAAVARKFWLPGISRVLVLAVALAVAEWLRGHLFTGLPWNVLGYALTAPDILMQSASAVGVYALAIPAVVIFTAPLVLIGDGQSLRRALAWTAVPLAVMAAYGAWRLPSGSAAIVPGVQLRIVQPSVPQREKWLPEHQGKIFEDHLALSQTNEAGARDDLNDVTHVIWPEAAMPFLPLERPEALAAIANMLPEGRQLITGALRLAKAGDAGFDGTKGGYQGYNSLLVFNDDGALAAAYDKIHLVPFGEFLPFEPVLSALGLKRLAHGHGSFLAGAEPRPVIAVAGLPPVGGLICYEALFPGTLVQSARRPGVLINLTNDGWFGTTTGPPAHFHQVRVRAVEEGIPVVRAANNGISGVIDPYGRVTKRLGLDARGVIDSPLPASISVTLYSQTGDGGLILLSFISVILAAYFARRRNN
jgi:apolipoprotein N-acyltransferase